VADRSGREFHDAHDLELIARAAAGDLAAAEATAAHRLLAACERCAELAADLRAIAAATRRLPSAADVSSVPSASSSSLALAPRDFRLTEADAARLRRRGWLGIDRLAEVLGGRSRGLGGALAAFGLVGLLVAAGMPSLLGGAGGAATALAPAGESLVQKDVSSAAPAPVEAATAAPAGAAPIPSDTYLISATPDPAAGAAAGGTTSPGADTTNQDASGTPERSRDGGTEAASGWAAVVLALVSAVMLVVGLNLLLAGRTRRRAGP
jgi:hypothetical protein